MNGIKNQLKKAVSALGYSIRKSPTSQSELLQFCYANGWLKDYLINTIIDIGANEGQFATKISALFQNARLICFEPLTAPFELLKKNLINVPDAAFYNYALGDSDTELVIHNNEFSPSSSFLNMDGAHKENFIYAVKTTENIVQVRTLDGLDLGIEGAYLVKIDVQGFEDKVIAGGSQTIGNAAVVIIEVSFSKLYTDQPLFDDIYRLMTDLGFLYHGNFEQMLSPVDNRILQADAIFINCKANGLAT
ncbi:MAG: hypothetical protein JWR09_2612 [Mucilaginibacter sp.]|nr:hypothetical protein [Mucilaginibacter sp.]